MEFDEDYFVPLEDREPVEEPDDYEHDESQDFIPVKQTKMKFTLYMAS
ncbi:MAG: hypothetical protein AABX51_05790 [Nanoarchaeota archaeon]